MATPGLLPTPPAAFDSFSSVSVVSQATDHPSTADAAAADLTRLEQKVASMRSVLVRLLQDVVQAESQLDSSQSRLLVEANEGLVLAAMQSRVEADCSAQALDEVSRSVGLDPLTQLPNRLLLIDRFTRAIASAKRRKEPLALLFVDLNNFKQLNDLLGHGVGDQALRFAAQCLVSAVRDVDTVSRHGGDEFLILLTEISQAADAVLVAGKAIAALGAPSLFGKHVLRLNASIGIALYPEDGLDAQTLIDRADRAMYEAKARGPGSCVFHNGPVLVAADRSPPFKSLQQPFAHLDAARAEQELRYEQMREANAQLIVSVITAQELQSAAEQARQRQVELLAIIAHELRNPLAPIRLAAAMLGRLRTEEPLLPRAQAIIERQTAQMTRLVGDLLDVTRSGTQSLRLELQQIDIVDAIDEAIEACRPAMDTRLQIFEVTVPSRALKLHADPGRLVQIFSNLINNASKYTPDGGVIKLSVAVTEDSLILTVQDNGIGISAEVLPQVFDPFMQDIHALGFNGEGLGVGLTVARQLVVAHGGSITAHSAGRGQGSQFVVTLPMDRGAQAAPD